MTDAIEKREQARHETGASLMFIGLALWVAGALVVFFLPAGMKLGHQTTFLAIIAALAVLGLVAMVKGYLMRGRPDE
jgi:Na+/melibiose symporter-like transporter